MYKQKMGKQRRKIKNCNIKDHSFSKMSSFTLYPILIVFLCF